MRLIMMGTGPFAVPTLRLLHASRHEVLALVTQPVRASRGRPAPPAPMRQLADEHGTPILDPEKINTDEARAALASLAPDLFVVADYGQILARETLAVARYGGVNLHGSLLPKYRGAAPINWAIYYGDAETGVTTIHMTPQVDAGPCLAQAQTPIDPEETAPQLEHRLAEIGAPLVAQTIDMLEQDRIEPLPQDAALSTRAPRLKKTDGAVNWSRTALEIKNQTRAMEPWPKTYTFWLRQSQPALRLILEHANVVPGPAGAPGKVTIGDGRLLVATGGGQLEIDRIQPAGKRTLTAGEFLRGYPVRSGDVLGPEPEQASE